MTGITNARHSYFQQLRIVGAVGFVTISAVLHDRRVLPQEWPAPFRMAAQTIFSGVRLDQLFWIRTSMWIVATRASHLTFSIRHVRRTLQLRAPHLVALQTELGLLLLDVGDIGQ